MPTYYKIALGIILAKGVLLAFCWLWVSIETKFSNHKKLKNDSSKRNI
jgi:hypothetical protein